MCKRSSINWNIQNQDYWVLLLLLIDCVTSYFSVMNSKSQWHVKGVQELCREFLANWSQVKHKFYMCLSMKWVSNQLFLPSITILNLHFKSPSSKFHFTPLVKTCSCVSDIISHVWKETSCFRMFVLQVTMQLLAERV